MTRRELKNHSDDWYFSSCHICEYNFKNLKLISYPENIQLAICPIPHRPNMPVPLPPLEFPVFLSESSGLRPSTSPRFQY
ncbi:hypothetical protein NPIL_173291 [Nephila pilipes]|uniref:Uncharacterized protein n=1 Tax=Nephila pilipes TaxID=299642 RepID=A0A8X6QJE0_NEPPI|nr:hypothetical protein NPIL_173291 [Nephila pilipes]